jgi:hypothetical protein
MSISRASGTVKRGQPAVFTVHVWVNDWSPAGKVTVSLSTVTAGQQAKFTTVGCHKHSSCTIATPGKKPAALSAQVTAKQAAKTVTIKAVGKATAGKLAQPLAVSESVRFAVPAPTAAASPEPTEPTLGAIDPVGAIEPGPIPTLNLSSTKLMSPGNAAGLFPTIAPSAAPTTAPTAPPNPSRTQTDQAVQVLPLGMSTVTAQVIGIAALALAVVLAVLTKLLPRRRTSK